MQTRGTDTKKSAGKTAGKTKKVKFQINAAPGSEVYVAGSFNNWDPAGTRMKQNGDGTYSAQVAICPGRHEYKFVVNGLWQADPGCRERTINEYGSVNSVVQVT